MKPPPFAYHRAESLEHALVLLDEHADDAKVIAGGQSLLPMMALRLARPEVLVDIGRLPGLADLHINGTGVEIGALVTHDQLEHLNAADADPRTVLRHAAGHIGHRPIRTRGTFGGSLAHADPSAEWCVLAVALDAQLAIHSSAQTRVEDATDFLQGPFWSSLAENEIVTSVRIGAFPDAAGFDEYSRRHGDFAIVLAAVAYDLHDGAIANARVVLGGIGPTPLRITEAERVLDGQVASPEVFREAAATVRREIDPPSDTVSAAYRRRLSEALVERAALRASGIELDTRSHR